MKLCPKYADFDALPLLISTVKGIQIAQAYSDRVGHISRQPGILEFRRFKVDPDKNWAICVFIGLFGWLLTFYGSFVASLW